MFSTNYYALVAGLHEYSLDVDIKRFDAKSILAEILEYLTKKDASAVRLLYAYYDCENLASLHAGRSGHNPLGNLSYEELEEELINPQRLPEEVAAVVRGYNESAGTEFDTDAISFDKAIFTAYYKACSLSSSRFLREWSEFDRTLRNVCAAVSARAAGRAIDEATVGGGDIAEQLERSSAADFGLRGELTWLDAVIAAVNDEDNIVDKERRIDEVRWEEAIELAIFDYFNIDRVLSYLVHINLVARWMVLDEKQGRKMLLRLMDELNGKDFMINRE